MPGFSILADLIEAAGPAGVQATIVAGLLVGGHYARKATNLSVYFWFVGMFAIGLGVLMLLGVVEVDFQALGVLVDGARVTWNSLAAAV